MISTSIVHDNVTFGPDSEVGDFCMIGIPPQGVDEGTLSTTFGQRAKILSHSVIYAGNEFGDDLAVGHGTYLRDGIRTGDRVNIGPLSIWEGKVTVGSDVNIGAQSGIAEYTVIGDGVEIGIGVGIAGVLHPLAPRAKETGRGPTIGNGVTVGEGATLLAGLRIGSGAYIEPGSVVLRDVLPFAVVAGNPAKQVGDVFELHPEVMSRVSKYCNTSPEEVEQQRKEFSDAPTHFPPR